MFASIINFFKQRQILPIFLVFCFSVIIIILPSTFKISISGIFINSLFYPFIKIDNFLTEISTARDNNTKLNQQIIKMSMKTAQYTEDHYENIRLRRMLNFDLQIPYRLVPAEVIGLKPDFMVNSIEINAGKSKNININNPVVNADGVIGKTIGITENTSVVQLLLDHNCKVSVIDQNTRAMGIVRWNGGKFLTMGDVPVESQVAVGDTIISSGLGGIFPPGLIVGVVVFSEDITGTLFKEIAVKPSVDFGSIEEVFVVIYGE